MLSNLIQLGVAAIVPIVVSFFKSKLPGKYIPIAATLLGAVAQYVAVVLTGGEFNPVITALLGASSVGIREIVDQLSKPAAS